MATANLAAVLTLDDRASAGLMNVSERTQMVRRNMGQSLSTLASFGNSLTGILVTSGALNSEQGRMISQTVAFTSAGLRLAQVLGLQNSALWAQVAALGAVRRAMVLTGIGAAAVVGGFALNRALESRAQQTVRGGGSQVYVDARGASFAGDAAFQEFGRSISRGVR